MSKESFDCGPSFIGDAQLAVGINVTGQDAGKDVAGGAAGQLDLGFILGPELFVFPEIRPVLRSIFRSNLVGIISMYIPTSGIGWFSFLYTLLLIYYLYSLMAVLTLLRLPHCSFDLYFSNS